jgi:hypothetical protein
MTALELKGSLFEVLGQIKEKSTLYKILNFVQRKV